MTRRLIPACVLIAGLAAAAQAQVPLSRTLVPAQGEWLNGRPLTPLARVGLERNWYTVAPLAGTERVLLISLSEKLLFVHTSESNLHAYDAETGRALWSANLGSNTREALPASVNGNAVLVAASHLLYGLDRTNGRTLWSLKLEAMPSSGTACDAERVSVGLSTGKLATYYLKNLQPAFFWQSNAVLTSQPILAGPVLAFASQDGKVYVARMQPPKLLFRFRTGGPITASLGTYGTRTLLIPSEDNIIYAVDLFNGETKWSVTTGSPIDQQPLVANKDVYAMNRAGVIHCIDAETGQERWMQPTGGGRLLSVAESRVYLETPFRDLFVVDRTTGKIVADPRSVRERAGLDVRDFDISPTNPLTGRIYLASSSGMVVCLRERGRQTPFLLRDPNAKPFGYVPGRGRGGAGAPAEAPSGAPAPAAEGAQPPAAGAQETPPKAPEGGEAAAPENNKEKPDAMPEGGDNAPK